MSETVVTKELKIAFITCHFPPDSLGGGQIQSLRVTKALSKGCKMTVFARDYSGTQQRIEPVDNFTLVRRRVSKIPFVRSILDLLKGLIFIFQSRKNYDLFLSFQIQLAALMVVLGKKFFEVVALVSPRGHEDFDFSPWHKRIFQKFVFKNASAILIQSEAIKRDFALEICRVFDNQTAEQIMDRVHIFPNVIDTFADHKKSEKAPSRIVFVGRLVDYKGVQYLIEALRRVQVDYELIVVGDGPYRTELERQATGLKVKFVGEVTPQEAQRYINTSFVLVLPSLTENLPNVVLEALSAGVPVVASAVGALPEIITDGWNGYLVSPKDSGLIADRVQRLLSSHVLWKEMSGAALESAKVYTPTAVLPRLQKVLSVVAETK